MPMQTITSAFSRSLAACVRMASICFSSIDEGRFTQPRKSFPAPFFECRSALASSALRCISAGTTTPDFEMSSLIAFIRMLFYMSLVVSVFMALRAEAPR